MANEQIGLALQFIQGAGGFWGWTYRSRRQTVYYGLKQEKFLNVPHFTFYIEVRTEELWRDMREKEKLNQKTF